MKSKEVVELLEYAELLLEEKNHRLGIALREYYLVCSCTGLSKRETVYNDGNEEDETAQKLVGVLQKMVLRQARPLASNMSQENLDQVSGRAR